MTLKDKLTRRDGDTHPKPCTTCGGPKVWKVRPSGTWYGTCRPCNSKRVSAKYRATRHVHGHVSKEDHLARVAIPEDRKAGDPHPKPCKTCGSGQVWRKNGGSSEWAAICRTCTPEREFLTPEEAKRRKSAKIRRWRRNNPEKIRAREAKRRAKLAQAPDDGWSFETMTRMKNTGEYTCFICEKATATEVEHLVPVSLGGGNTWDNLALACRSCNSSKGAHVWPGSPGWDEFLQKRRGG